LDSGALLKPWIYKMEPDMQLLPSAN